MHGANLRSALRVLEAIFAPRRKTDLLDSISCRVPPLSYKTDLALFTSRLPSNFREQEETALPMCTSRLVC